MAKWHMKLSTAFRAPKKYVILFVCVIMRPIAIWLSFATCLTRFVAKLKSTERRHKVTQQRRPNLFLIESHVKNNSPTIVILFFFDFFFFLLKFFFPRESALRTFVTMWATVEAMGAWKGWEWVQST